MTEIERIIQKGVITEEYLKPEIRDDFLVTTERKKLFAVLLDMLLEIDSVCKKHNIKYFLDGGTLLGAIRHKGFIPWDDDLDIVMLREDYDKFIQLKDEFKQPYFLQTPYTDNGFFWSNIAIRNSNTTAVTPYFAYQPMNHGAFIDIFVYDNMVNNEQGRNVFNKIDRLIIDNSTYMRMSNPNLDENQNKRIEEYKKRLRDPFEVYEEIQKLAKTFNDVDTDFLYSSFGTIYGFDKTLYNKVDYNSSVLVSFEGYEFPAPIGYENRLKITYGDYMKFPPVEERGLHHNILFDMDTPYKEYIEKFIR